MFENCRCGTNEKEKIIIIEYLSLDLNTCERCVQTDKVLDGVLDELRHAFKIAGYSLEYHKVLIETAEMAAAYKFISSPTIRVNGRDICKPADDNICNCCGDIAGTQLDCPVFSYNGKKYEVPPAEMIAEAIIQWALVPQLPTFCSDGYVLPDNLKKFFESKNTKCGKSACSCVCR